MLPIRWVFLLGIASFWHLWAHPGSGLVVDLRKHVFFTDTGRGIWEATAEGSLRLVSTSALHWLAASARTLRPATQGKFELLLPNGSDLALVLSSDFPCAVAADGTLIYADTRGATRIVRRHVDGREEVVVGRMTHGVPGQVSSLHAVTGLCVNSDDTILVTEIDRDSSDCAVREIRAQGTVVTRARNFVPLGPDRRRAEPADVCRGVATTKSGIVYVAAPVARCVVSIDRQGMTAIVLRSPEPWSPTAVTTYDDDVYVLEYTDTPPGADPSDRSVWVPRIRRVSDGKVNVIATVRR